jgi:hypothetical protein
VNNYDITKIKGIPEGSWVWCLHCERCYKAGEYRKESSMQLCPYPDCDGDTVMDSWAWERLREIHPDYPKEPERDKVYPLYF